MATNGPALYSLRLVGITQAGVYRVLLLSVLLCTTGILVFQRDPKTTDNCSGNGFGEYRG
ncbi:hypothetical protein JIR001_08040 [Polycladomyces abyssicola]|uniref:Uncharacterized protein n=1 Tax=Polycladomyces abyssicola TaxID=1125966 RepID=A0A8D5UEI4_9BACL|nr:hypothetical protein JIR001_08040 [Polycladomyces abyssicola]